MAVVPPMPEGQRQHRRDGEDARHPELPQRVAKFADEDSQTLCSLSVFERLPRLRRGRGAIRLVWIADVGNLQPRGCRAAWLRYAAAANHQGIGNEFIRPLRRADGQGRVRRRHRIGGELNYYYRAA